MEGKEVRFGINASALFATITTAASCGAVNAMHDSSPRWGRRALVLMQLGEVVFGGGLGPVRHAGSPSWRCSSPG
jgi:K+-transporting ATPase ATPase A chain